MRRGDVPAGSAHPSCRSVDWPEARTPPEHEEVRAIGVVDFERRDVVGDPRDAVGPDARHQRVVLGLVADVSGHVLLFEASDPMLEPGRAGNRPRPGEVLVAGVGKELVAVVRFGGEAGVQRRQLLEGWNQPRLG